jgi:hypothetical protein
VPTHRSVFAATILHPFSEWSRLIKPRFRELLTRFLGFLGVAFSPPISSVAARVVLVA